MKRVLLFFLLVASSLSAFETTTASRLLQARQDSRTRYAATLAQMSVDITDLSNQQKLDEFTSKLYRISCELSTLKWRFDQAVSPEAKEASRQAYEQKLSEYDSTLNELEKWVGSLR